MSSGRSPIWAAPALLSHVDAIVYLVRHGHHDWLGPGGRIAGRLPIGLSTRGREEMARVADALAAHPLSWVAASPLQRTVESAQIIAAPRGLLVARDERFSEWGVGPWEGLPIEEIRRRYPEQWQLWREDPEKLRLPDAESVAQMAERMEAGCLEWMDRGGSGVIVSHQDPLGALLCRLIGLPLTQMRRLDIGTGSVSTVRRSRHGTIVESINALGALT